MKALSCIICLFLLLPVWGAGIKQMVNPDQTIAEQNNSKKKKSFKNFLQTVEIIQGHKLRTADRLKLKTLYHIQRFSNHSQKKANRLVLVSLAFSVTGLVLIAAISAIGLFSFFGLAFCITGFILSIIAFNKGKKQPGFLKKRNMIIATIACVTGLIGISLAIFLTLLLLVFGFIGESVASISTMIG